MQKSQERDAAKNNSFHFRRNVFPSERPQTAYDLNSRPASPPSREPSYQGHARSNGTRVNRHERSQSRASTRCSSPDEEVGGCEVVEMTLDEVINGRGESFPGLMGLVNAYLNSLNVDVGTKCELRRYLDLIKHRAKGELMFYPWAVRADLSTVGLCLNSGYDSKGER